MTFFGEEEEKTIDSLEREMKDQVEKLRQKPIEIMKNPFDDPEKSLKNQENPEKSLENPDFSLEKSHFSSEKPLFSLTKSSIKQKNEGKSLGESYQNLYQDFLTPESRDPIHDARTLGFALSSYHHDLSSRYFYRNNCYKLAEKLQKINHGFENIGKFEKPIVKARFTVKEVPIVAERKEVDSLIRIEENPEDLERRKWLEDREKSLVLMKEFLKT